MKTPRLISFKLAQKIIIREKKNLFQESKIKLKEAHNAVVSRTITSPINLPLQNTAGLDGYIVSNKNLNKVSISCLLYTSPSPRDPKTSRMPSSA